MKCLFQGYILLRCLSCLHAGVYRDKAGCGVTVPYHLTSLAYIQHHEMSTRYVGVWCYYVLTECQFEYVCNVCTFENCKPMFQRS